MDSSPGFGPHHAHQDIRPIQTRFRYGSTALAPLNLGRTAWVPRADTMNSPDHSTKGTPSPRHRPRRDGTSRALTACKCRVSGSISFPLRGAFHLSLTVLVRYRWPKVVRLGGWSPQLPTGFLVSRGTQEQEPTSRTPSCTGLSPSLVELSSSFP